MTKPVLAAALLPLLLVAAAACTRADGSGGVASVNTAAAASATPSLSIVEQGRKHAQCMRDHGVPEADPIAEPNGGFHLGGGYDKQALTDGVLEQAIQACKPYTPILPAADLAGKVAGARQLAQCMRDHGVEGFPDPDPNDLGRTLPDAVRDDPQYEQARQACEAPGGKP